MPDTSVKLNNGTSIPGIGFGTGTGLWGKDCTDLVLSALQKGYRYLDTAQGYSNAGSVGEALRQAKGIKREDVYILTKCKSFQTTLFRSFGKDGVPDEEIEPRKVLMDQLKLLGVEHVDMYLIHNPFFAKPNFQECWKTMEALQKEGLTRSIGVSNFREEDILEIKKVWTIPPAVNQIEYHPYVYHAPNMLRLRKLLDAENIKIQSYGPLSPLFRFKDGSVDKVVDDIAKKHEVTAAQVLLAWARQHTSGILVTTSRNDERQREQLEAIEKVVLTADEVERIATLGKEKFCRWFQHGVWDEAKA